MMEQETQENTTSSGVVGYLRLTDAGYCLSVHKGDGKALNLTDTFGKFSGKEVKLIVQAEA